MNPHATDDAERPACQVSEHLGKICVRNDLEKHEIRTADQEAIQERCFVMPTVDVEALHPQSEYQGKCACEEGSSVMLLFPA